MDKLYEQILTAVGAGAVVIVGLLFKRISDIINIYLDRLATVAEGKASADALASAVTTAVKAVEQTTKDTTTGAAEKKAQAVGLLDQQGLLGDKVQVDTLIEAAVHDLPKAGKLLVGTVGTFCPPAAEPAPAAPVAKDDVPLWDGASTPASSQ